MNTQSITENTRQGAFSYGRLGYFTELAVRLLDAGYIEGQEYSHCVKMAEWHPKIDEFLGTLPGGKNSENHQRSFGLIALAIPQAIRFRRKHPLANDV